MELRLKSSTEYRVDGASSLTTCVCSKDSTTNDFSVILNKIGVVNLTVTVRIKPLIATVRIKLLIASHHCFGVLFCTYCYSNFVRYLYLASHGNIVIDLILLRSNISRNLRVISNWDLTLADRHD